MTPTVPRVALSAEAQHVIDSLESHFVAVEGVVKHAGDVGSSYLKHFRDEVHAALGGYVNYLRRGVDAHGYEGNTQQSTPNTVLDPVAKEQMIRENQRAVQGGGFNPATNTHYGLPAGQTLSGNVVGSYAGLPTAKDLAPGQTIAGRTNFVPPFAEQMDAAKAQSGVAGTSESPALAGQSPLGGK